MVLMTGNETVIRQLTVFEQLLCRVDSTLRILAAPPKRIVRRKNPAEDLPATQLNNQELRQVVGLMRVNHAGEICAQALYQGQAATAKLTHIKTQMQEAAEEEIEHLAWCEQRLQTLHSHPSRLNPLWYTCSYLLGAFAGLFGDRLSLGFVAETERQVTAHLQRHLQKIPPQDLQTKAILQQMQQDEMAHAQTAETAGAVELPVFVKQLMRTASKLMTLSSYYI